MPLVFLPIVTLTSCFSVKTEISRDEFMKLANKTTPQEYKYAKIKCKATLKSESKENPKSNRDEKIDRTFKYCYTVSSWYADSTQSTADFSSTEKQFYTQFIVYLKTNVKDILKREPFTNDDEAGLICYKNNLAYRYKVRYNNYKTSSENINCVTNGTSLELISFNDKSGAISSYYEKDDIAKTYTYDKASMTITDDVEVQLTISYSNT